jgi:predicted ribosome quality control (RQC) complex YloA/Tae2 family protein
MTLRAAELAAVCREIEGALVGLPVHKVVQPDDETILLQLRGRWLLLCVSARGGRLHLAFQAGDRPSGSGEAAPAFCMLLRKHLVGSRLVSVEPVEGERACELVLASADDHPRLRLFLFGPAAQLQLLARGEDGEPRVLGAIGPARRVYEALPAPHPTGADRQIPRFPDDAPSIAIETAYRTEGHDQAVAAARRSIAQRLDAELRKQTRLVAALERDRDRAIGSEARRRHADLILAHLGEIPRGAAQVRLPDDHGDGSPIDIALDPARSARENAERLYKEHKRLQRARATVSRRLAEAVQRVAELEAERARLEGLSDDAILAQARPEPTPARRAREAREGRALPYRRYTSASGQPIYVGRGAAKNDELTFRVARGNDLWLHTRDVPGAHVVVPLSAGRSADADTLVDAATLAAYHSNAREEGQVDVGYALRKHLRKPKGAAPGTVLVAQQKTIRVRMEPARIERLLKTRAED